MSRAGRTGSSDDRTNRLAALLGLWLGLSFVLALPVYFTLDILGASSGERSLAVIGTSGLVLLVIGLHALGPARRGWLWLVPLLLLLFVVRLVQHGTVDFSGAGFTDEFFLHLQGESVGVALQEYDRLARRGLVLVLIALALVFGLTRRPVLARPRSAGIAMAVGGVLLISGIGLQPEVQFIRAWQQWNAPRVSTVDPDVLERWSESGLVDPTLRGKHRVDAVPSDPPRNLVLVYLESIGNHLVEQPRWPDLMPNLERLMASHGWVDHLWASGYITIEGLTNSQCGTLLPFDRGSDSLAEGAGLAGRLPCLGDVLGAAGYRQVYLGGAGTTFAGKGAFLQAHGFGQVLGIEDWRERGLEQRPGTWGLSDADLFEQSLSWIRDLEQEDAPWNLTLLTIGTHLPGYRYAECSPYPHADDRFLDAVHCTDQLLDRWIDTLRSSDVLDDTVVVITADHHVFASDDMKGLFGDGVYDRRLPMVVLGATDVKPVQSVGASYDLAPTVLDLLGVDHDAEFAVGRSLARPRPGPSYFVTRYHDFYQGEMVINPTACSPSSNEDYPIDRCRKDELISVLNGLAARFSLSPDRLQCGDRAMAEAAIVDGERPRLEVRIGGRDQSERFIWRGRAVSPDRPGWYLMMLGAEGDVIGRRFQPFDREIEAETEALMNDLSGSSSVLVARLGGSGGSAGLPSLLEILTDVERPLNWIRLDEPEVLVEGTRVDPGWQLTLDKAACLDVMGS